MRRNLINPVFRFYIRINRSTAQTRIECAYRSSFSSACKYLFVGNTVGGDEEGVKRETTEGRRLHPQLLG